MQHNLFRSDSHHCLALRCIAGAALACACASPASAQSLRPAGYFVQGGGYSNHVWSVTGGITWPWAWRSTALGTEVSGQTEAFVSHWDAKRLNGGRRGITQVGLVPMFRFRPEQGSSPWFVEGGIGVSSMDNRFMTPEKSFPTRFNFVDVVGVARSFGPARDQEIGLRVQHVSNAGIRRPNPGQNMLLLRYGASF